MSRRYAARAALERTLRDRSLLVRLTAARALCVLGIRGYPTLAALFVDGAGRHAGEISDCLLVLGRQQRELLARLWQQPWLPLPRLLATATASGRCG